MERLEEFPVIVPQLSRLDRAARSTSSTIDQSRSVVHVSTSGSLMPATQRFEQNPIREPIRKAWQEFRPHSLGRRFRALTILDAFARECPAIEVDQAVKADPVVAMLERLAFLRGTAPAKIRVDDGPEFISRVLDHWAYRHSVTLDLPRPGEPTDIAFAESFNGRLWDECLCAH